MRLSCAVLALATACAADGGVGRLERAAAVEGPWKIPAEVLAAGDEQLVDYTGAGPWIGEEGCGGGLLEGTRVFRDYLYAWFPQAYTIGGYACRPIVGDSDTMSVHATGRALDVMIQTVDGEADNDLGDPIGNWLIESSERIGIQQIIWDRWLWRADREPGSKDSYYSGQHPHHDHLHVELSLEAADLQTAFFAEPQGPPETVPCGTVAAEGGVIDQVDACAHHFGPGQYWRSVDGEGWEGALLWTNAFESAQPSNWARWTLVLAAGGRYRVEVHVPAPWGVADDVRYEIKHGAETSALYLDQSRADGWTYLGDYEFVEGASQHVTLYDNADHSVADEQRIVFDALRLTPCPVGVCPDATGPFDPTDPTEPPSDEDVQVIAGGCDVTGRGRAPAWLGLLIAAYAASSSRRARRSPSTKKAHS